MTKQCDILVYDCLKDDEKDLPIMKIYPIRGLKTTKNLKIPLKEEKSRANR